MDWLENLRAVVLVAQHESFSTAARRHGVSPSVMIKRVNAAEWRLRATLFARTTRNVALTETGQRLLPRLQMLVHDLDELFASLRQEHPAAGGTLRICVATAFAAEGFNTLLSGFLSAHAGVRLEVVLLDRPVDPEAEGFDVAIDDTPAAWAHVVDIPLFARRFVLVATARYLQRHGTPSHPRDLRRHATLGLASLGSQWTFRGADRPVTIAVTPSLMTSDGVALVQAAIAGRGIALLPEALVSDALAQGTLQPVMNDFTPAQNWVTARVPEAKRLLPRVEIFLAWLQRDRVNVVNGVNL